MIRQKVGEEGLSELLEFGAHPDRYCEKMRHRIQDRFSDRSHQFETDQMSPSSSAMLESVQDPYGPRGEVIERKSVIFPRLGDDLEKLTQVLQISCSNY